MSRPLSDTDKQLLALGAEIERERERNDTPVIVPSESSARMEKMILEHEKACWGKDGPLGSIQADINNIKAWGKAVALLFLCLQAANAYKVFIAPPPQPIQIVMPRDAHAVAEQPHQQYATKTP